MVQGTPPGWVDRDLVADLVVSILGSQRSAWNIADVRGKTEVLLAEDITARATNRCTRLLEGSGVPEHVRALTSSRW
jgi:hypothetical protein